MNIVVYVRDTNGNEWEYPAAARYLTEDVTNNLLLMDDDDTLIGVWAETRWAFVGLRESVNA